MTFFTVLKQFERSKNYMTEKKIIEMAQEQTKEKITDIKKAISVLENLSFIVTETPAEVSTEKLTAIPVRYKRDYYCQYDGQYQLQPAYFYLNVKNATFGCTYNAEIGNAVTMDIWYGITLTWHFPANSYLQTVKKSFKQIFPLAQKVFDIVEVEYNDNGNPYLKIYDQEKFESLENEIYGIIEDNFTYY